MYKLKVVFLTLIITASLITSGYADEIDYKKIASFY
jgi:hypothetical protein